MRLLLVALGGLLAAGAWSFGFNWVYYHLYLAVGAPEQPTLLLLAAIGGLSALFGVLGALACLLAARRIRWAPHVFFGASVALILSVAGLGAGLPGILQQLQSQGFWGFLLGALATFYVARPGIAAQKSVVTDAPHAVRSDH